MHQEAPGLRHADDRLGEVGGAPRGQRAQRGHLGAHSGLAPPVAAGDQLVDEALPAGEFGEVAGAAQDQRLVERDLEMVVLGLDGAILVGLPGIVAARQHAVMGAEGIVAPGHVRRGVGIEVAIMRRKRRLSATGFTENS